MNAVVPLDELESTTVAWCREMLGLSPLALRLLKAGANAGHRRPGGRAAAGRRRHAPLLHERGGAGGARRVQGEARARLLAVPEAAVSASARLWWRGARPRTLGLGVVPVLVGVAAAGHVIAWRFVAALVVAAGLQIGVNFANDYFDGVRGVDTAERMGPPRLVASGAASPRAVLTAALVVVSDSRAPPGWRWRSRRRRCLILVVGALALVAALLYSRRAAALRRPRARRADGVRVLRAHGDVRLGVRDGGDRAGRRVVGRRGDGAARRRGPGGEQPPRHPDGRGGRQANARRAAGRPADARRCTAPASSARSRRSWSASWCSSSTSRSGSRSGGCSG